MNKSTKRKLLKMLDKISAGFDHYQETEFDDENASDKFWSALSTMQEFIESIPAEQN